MQLKVDEEFKALIPPLSGEERAGLEKSIIEEGCRDSIVTWQGVIVDGHNRYEICTAHGIPFNVIEKDFADRDEAHDWIIDNQCSRRNISDALRISLQLKKSSYRIEQAKRQHAQAVANSNKRRADPSFQNSEIMKPTPKINVTREIAESIGVSTDTVSRVRQIEQHATPEVKEAVLAGTMSINEGYKRVRAEKKKQEREKAIEEAHTAGKESRSIDLYDPPCKYRVIYADPPWSYNDKQNTGTLGGAEKHYDTMPLEDICALPVPSTDEAVLFMWVTSPMLEDSFKVINAWGFKYKSSFVWDKVLHNMGHYNSVRHEFLLIATKGSCTPDVQRLHDSVVSIKREEHSRKPEEFRDIIDEIYPIGDRLEMFARTAPEGWDVWGNMV